MPGTDSASSIAIGRSGDIVPRSVLYTSGETDPRTPLEYPSATAPQARYLMGQDPRLPPMPDAPTLVDFFAYRCAPAAHLLQCARLAQRAGHPDKVVVACLLHDIAICGFIRADHGYWGAQLIEPYVDPEISWAVRMHQALRFFADESVGYEYPASYRRLFGDDYQPDPYIVAEYHAARKHSWYMTARLVTLYDDYSFDPTVKVDFAEFTDILARHFRQPPQGLGFDGSPAAHLWRTMIAPTRTL